MWSLHPTCLAIVVAPVRALHAAAPVTPPHVDGLMAFGATAMLLMLLCRGHHYLSPRWAIGTSIFAMMSAAYGFLLGAWPLGIGLIVFSIHSLVSFLQRGRRNRAVRPARGYWARQRVHSERSEESRLSRMFGRN